ncbi:multiple cyclophane-containing RiPP AmcA [Streptomyces luteolus]|uniref:Uncharacterized protein n=1 Tax=Streptomyces luteolus TaxID=3043615 RepID=A0ABT6SXS9_9ACTN|nr:multiple cyclophane-containing RiPP AmcA [Streptomyces sp. B-S-A12]MDI3420396.1 hypothetical protein [Streptomyces sp. B-S-A12]
MSETTNPTPTTVPVTAADLVRASADRLCALLGTCPPAFGGKFDNRPTWSNTSPAFDNRPTWDNWDKK